MGFKSNPIAIGTSNTDVFQMGTGLAGAIVLGIGNQTSGAIAYTVKIFKLATGVTTTIVTSQSLAGNQFKKFEVPIALEAGDKVVMTAVSTGISALATVTDSSVAPAAQGYTPRGNYSDIATYSINDVVAASDGGSYISTEDGNIGNDPTSSPMSWMVNAEKGDTGEAGDTAMSIVRVAATTNITIASALEDGDTVDGVTLATGDLVLLAGQTAPAENGVYTVAASGQAGRASGFSTYDSYPGRYFSVMEGTVGADKLYRCTSNKGGTLGTTALVVSEFSSGGIGNTDTSVSTTPLLAHLHFKCMKGTGWSDSPVEAGGLLTYTVSTAATAGSNTIVLTATPSFQANQLIVYVDAAGRYRTSVIKSLSGGTITTKEPLEAALPSGNLVGNFWNDEIHPNANGNKAFVDYALEETRIRKELVYKWTPDSPYEVYNTAATTSSLSSLSYVNPGSTTRPALKFVSNASAQGMLTPGVYLEAGYYLARVTLVGNTESGSADTANTRVFVLEDGTANAFSPCASRSAASVDAFFPARNGRKTQIQISTDTTVGTGFAISQVEIYRVIEMRPSIDFGDVVVLGDSYVSGNMVAAFAARLPKANVINAGVSGNTTTQMLARYAADVAALNPSTVIVVAEGANDYAGSVTVDTYDRNVAALIGATSAINAETFMIGASVGPKAHSTLGDLLTLSRNYVLNTKIGAANSDETALTAYTPTQTGTATGTPSGFYRRDGSLLWLYVQFAATSTGTVILSMPPGLSAPVYITNQFLTGWASASGSQVYGLLATNTGTITIKTPTFTDPAASGTRLGLSGVIHLG